MRKVGKLLSLLMVVSLIAACSSSPHLNQSQIVGIWEAEAVSVDNGDYVPLPGQRRVGYEFHHDGHAIEHLRSAGGTDEVTNLYRYSVQDGDTLFLLPTADNPNIPQRQFDIRLEGNTLWLGHQIGSNPMVWETLRLRRVD